MANGSLTRAMPVERLPASDRLRFRTLAEGMHREVCNAGDIPVHKNG